jgi:predicted transcriptional regulator
MNEQGWSWVRALETGTLTVHQRESLQALVDDGQADSLKEAAELMDRDIANRVDREA